MTSALELNKTLNISQEKLQLRFGQVRNLLLYLQSHNYIYLGKVMQPR